MPGHSRSKNGVASLAYVPGIHALLTTISVKQGVDGRDKPGHDNSLTSARNIESDIQIYRLAICASG
jgi:hypothetical protein